ncbi:MAG TPA: SDR family NAD(P)-dependent oxidoreductase [Haliangium sp.]|nr:SDR family NAD(P)-dependent oxidoreductase [Haliangium sp.]
MPYRDATSPPRVVLITGATGVIGKAIAHGIAVQGGHEVVLACRNRAKAERTVRDIARESGNPRVRYELVDVSRYTSVTALAARWQGPLHVLINNASTAPRAREETPEGLERVFATNVLGYFWMTQAFADVLARSTPARVVLVASYWAGGLDLDDVQFERRRYDNDAAYRQSKQAERMLARAFADRLRDRGVVVNACHPGDVASALSHSLGFGGSDTPEQSAETPMWLATGPDTGATTGSYFEHMRERSCRFGANREAVEALYQTCQGFAD